MTDKELIKEEIKRLDDKYRELRVSGTTQQAKEADLVVHVLLQISNFIDSIPEEPNMKNEDSSDECPCCGWSLDSDGCCGSCGYGRR